LPAVHMNHSVLGLI